MSFTAAKRAPKCRHLRFEPLEDRRVMSVSAAWDWSTFAANDDGFTISKNSPQQEFHVLANDWDAHPVENSVSIREQLRITSVTIAEHGSVGISEDGRSVLYTPSRNFTGIDQFSYAITNEDGEQDDAKIFIHVAEPIFAMPDWFRVDEGSASNELDVLKNDSWNFRPFFKTNDPGPSFQIVEVGHGSHDGTLSVSEDRQRIIYRPASDFEGLESFTYVIEDDAGSRTEATALVQVTTVDEDNLHQAWKEQVAQQLLEAAVQRSEFQFGRFTSDVFVMYPYELIDVDGIRIWPVTRLAATDSTTSLATDFSQTNVQVDGVDEGDVVKTDGDYLYILSDWMDEEAETVEHQLIIVDVRDPAETTVVSRVGLDGDVIEQFLNGDRVTVLSQLDDQLIVTMLDVSDRAHPTLLYESSIHGTLESARAIGDFVHVIASHDLMQLPTPEEICVEEDTGCFYETKQQFVTRIQGNIIDEASFKMETHNANGDLVDTQSLLESSQLLELTQTSRLSYSAVVTFDVTGDETGPTASTVFSHGTTSEVYVSTEAIYVLDQANHFLTPLGRFDSYDVRTNIHKLSLSGDGDVSWVASGSVVGQVLNQFSVDEYDGYLRVATTSGWWGGDNSLYVLQQSDRQLEVVGSVEGLAPGERIYSARFDGERGFVVTFQKVDPLFVFDLSNPTNPEVRGQLKISGYSNYLQLIDENHLLGIGREANGNGLFQEIQVSLFDISDVDNPTMLHRYSFEGGRNLWSPIMADAWNLGTHHSVNYFPSQHVLAMPTYEGNGWGWSWARNGNVAEASMQVLDIDIVEGIHLLGQVDMGVPFDPVQARSARIDDVLYSISPEMITANELRNPANELSRLTLGVAEAELPQTVHHDPSGTPVVPVQQRDAVTEVVFGNLPYGPQNVYPATPRTLQQWLRLEATTGQGPLRRVHQRSLSDFVRRSVNPEPVRVGATDPTMTRQAVFEDEDLLTTVSGLEDKQSDPLTGGICEFWSDGG